MLAGALGLTDPDSHEALFGRTSSDIGPLEALAMAELCEAAACYLRSVAPAVPAVCQPSNEGHSVEPDPGA